MKIYKIFSIAFIVICAGFLIGLFAFDNFSAGQKIVFAVCLCVVILIMAFNLRMINKKQKRG